MIFSNKLNTRLVIVKIQWPDDDRRFQTTTSCRGPARDEPAGRTSSPWRISLRRPASRRAGWCSGSAASALLVALGGSRRAPLRFAGLRAAHGGPLATLRAYAACMADLAPTPEALLRNLAYLQGDWPTRCSGAPRGERARASRREIESLLRAAVAAGELRREVDVRSLARTVETVIGGSLMSWATVPRGEGGRLDRTKISKSLAPWLGRRAQARNARSSRPTSSQ